MGFDLREKHKIFTVEQYEKLKNEELYFNNRYDLELIDKYEAERIIDSYYLEYFEAQLNNNFDEIIELLQDFREIKENFSLREFIEECLDVEMFYSEVDIPITMDFYLEEMNECYELCNRYIQKEEIEGKEFYLLVEYAYD